MKCPRCSLFDIPDGAPGCAVCGYQLPGITAETTPPPAASASFLWFSTKHVEGRSITEIVRTSGPMDLAHCLRTLEQVASALDYAHRRGVVHGALSSSNVVLDANEWALVGDFAVAEVVVSARAAAEAFNARGPTAGADQYALAALAYECLSGTRPAGDASPKLSELRADI